MYNSVEEYLQKQQQEMSEREKKERLRVMYKEGLMEKVYATEANPNTKEYPHVDEAGKRYKLRYLPITDEQYEQVKKYSDAKQTEEQTVSEPKSAFYSNIGGKIQNLAGVFLALGAFATLALGFILIGLGLFMFPALRALFVILGVLVIIVGLFLNWTGTFVLYGFGQLVENSDKLVALKQQEKDKA